MADERIHQHGRAGGQSNATERCKSRRAILTRVGLLVGIMAVAFIVVLPRIVDYGAVAAAPSTLTAIQIAALVTTTAFADGSHWRSSKRKLTSRMWRRRGRGPETLCPRQLFDDRREVPDPARPAIRRGSS